MAESTFSLVATTTSWSSSPSLRESKSPVAMPTLTSGRSRNASYFSVASARSGTTNSEVPSLVSIASCAMNVFPLAVGTAATTDSSSATPASTAATCGGYNSSIP